MLWLRFIWNWGNKVIRPPLDTILRTPTELWYRHGFCKVIFHDTISELQLFHSKLIKKNLKMSYLNLANQPNNPKSQPASNVGGWVIEWTGLNWLESSLTINNLSSTYLNISRTSLGAKQAPLITLKSRSAKKYEKIVV